jgi:predicted 3-demethylubiquinone-9 3-methyltransferase (glyoxalase superfamily)
MKKAKVKKVVKNVQKIVPCLWFDRAAEEAMQYYVGVFNGAPDSKKKSRIVSIARYEKGFDAPQAAEMEGKVLTGIFELNGQRFMCLDGGPYFKFNEAVSMYVECRDQKEVDYFWEKLSAVPESEQCGWVKDKFGVSWQIVPKRLGELLQDKDREKAHRVGNAMLKMKKLMVAGLEKAFKE